jgi:hypothetical protein
VYVSLGNMPQLQDRPTAAVVGGLSPARGGAAAFRVLWMVPKEQLQALPKGLPPHFRAKVLGQLPHVSILAHPSVAAVVSHCGMGAAQEALYFGKPLLCLPFFADQHDVARRVVDAGAGLMLDKGTVTAEGVRQAAQALMQNRSFAEGAARVAGHLRAAGGVRAAADALESVLRVGTDHLRTADLSMPWHKAAMLDVYVVCSALVALVALLLVLGWWFLSKVAEGFTKDLWDRYGAYLPARVNSVAGKPLPQEAPPSDPVSSKYDASSILAAAFGEQAKEMGNGGDG